VAITWRADYAIRLMYELAVLGEGAQAPVRVLAVSASVPYDYARTIARELVKADLLTSRRGAQGGLTLARPADKITLLQIFEGMKECTSLSLCTEDPSVCPRTETCPIHNAVWAELDQHISAYLKSTTLARAVQIGEKLKSAAASE